MVVPVLQIGLPGTQEMMIILLIAVLLFGANKIPKLARSTGQAMGEFQKGREEVEQELEEIKNTAPSSDDFVETDSTDTDVSETGDATETRDSTTARATESSDE